MREGGQPLGTSEISGPGAKFCLGCFAGLCSAFFPRLFVALNMSDASRGDVIIFEWSFILCALICSLIIGAVVMILEWNVLSKPGKTFMMALGIPALLSGGINTNSAINLYEDRQNSLRVEEEIQRENPINTINIPTTKIEPLGEAPQKEESKRELAVFRLWGVAQAHAADSFKEDDTLLAFTLKEKLYFIVLDRALDEQGAIARARELSAVIGQARAVKIGDQYFILLGDEKLPRTEALLRADQLRKAHPDLGLRVELLPYEKP